VIELSDIKTGTLMSLQLESAMRRDADFELSTIFEAELGNESFTVAAPIWQGSYYRILPSDTVHVNFIFDSLRQHFEAKAVEEFTRGELAFLTLLKTTPITEVQLREDFRISVMQDANLIFSEPVSDGGEAVTRVRPVRLRDLSGGGVGFYTNWDPGRLTEVMMEIHLESSVAQINTEIRRIEADVAEAGYSYSVGAKFNFSTEHEKERVVRHIFNMQKRMIQQHGRRKKT
jgi:c-di-GMP-binding flagellar brake protein YcgR